MKRVAQAGGLRRWSACLLWAAAFLPLAPADAAGAAEAGATLRNRFGVSIHQISDAREWDRIVEAGFGVVRMDLTWERVESVRGRYDWSYYDDMAQALRVHGLRPLFVLDYGNALYSPRVQIPGHGNEMRAAAPTDDVAMAAFAAFASEAARRYQALDPIWEIWNEPESDEMWPPHGDTAQFVELAARSCDALRRAAPSAEIVSPGAAKVPTDQDPRPALLQAMLASRLKTCLSGLSLHPYLFVSALDNTARTWTRVRAILPDPTPQGRPPLQLVSSESGVSTFKGQVSESQQAAYIARMMMLNLESDVAVSVWYDWRDDGDDGDNPQHRFGLVRRDLSPKPAWQAMRTLSTQLRGLQFRCRASVVGAPVTQLVFDGGGSARLVAWNSSRETSSVVLNVGATKTLAGAVGMLGDGLAIQAADARRVSLTLSPQPVYIALKGLSAAGLNSLCLKDAAVANAGAFR